MTQGDKILRPYGLWPSPISPEMMGGQLRLDDVQWDSDGTTLVWLEGRSGASALVMQREGDAGRELNGPVAVKAGVGYGGGDFTVARGTAFFAGRDGRLYRRELGYGQPRPITPAFGQVAAPALSPDGRWLLYVHSYERVDALGLVPADGSAWPARFAAGADFYMQPAWSPDARAAAWVEWDHPNMPWDGTRLMLADLEGEPPRAARTACIAGDGETPVFQPQFSPDGRWLSYLTTAGEVDRLVLYDRVARSSRTLVEGGELRPPAWQQGQRRHGWSADGTRIYYVRNDSGFFSLWVVDVDSGRSETVDGGPYTWFDQLSVAPTGGRLAYLASHPTVPQRVVVWEGGRTRVVRRRDPEAVPPEDYPVPREISWQARDGATVYGLYYPPTSSRFRGEDLPPAVVYVHGGPTSQVTSKYDADAGFFTSRGYAYLAVNYRGSTGYGRSYMLALRGRWGDLDVEDVVGGARALADQGLADAGRIVIKGGSAGGYAVLNALIRCPGVFKAGLCSYGVSNLFHLARDTHKFEERYNDSLVGPLPEAAQRYREWSPVFSADRIQDALAIFQGSEDNVVPQEQSEVIVQVLRERGVPHLYRLYPGEGHGWRKAETITDFYREMERFLQEQVLFA